MAVFFYLTSLTLVSLVLWYWCKFGRILRLCAAIPGPPTRLLIGNLHQLGSGSTELFNNLVKIHKEYGPNFRVHIGPFRTTVFFNHPKQVEIMLTSYKWLKKSSIYTNMHPWLGQGVLTSSGKIWKRQRKIISPAFHFTILEQFVPVFHSQGAILVEKMAAKLDGEEFDVVPFMTMFTLDVICETAMGTCVNAQENSETEYAKAVKELCAIVMYRAFHPFGSWNFIFSLTKKYQAQQKALKVVDCLVDKVIEERKKHINNMLQNDMDENTITWEADGGKKRMAFLDLLLQSKDDLGNHLPIEKIKHEVHTFMFAGHDTTNVAMSFSLYLLSIQPEIQDKVFQEQRDMLGDDLERLPTYREIQDMTYLTMVIKEVMRIYSPIPMFSRHLQEEVNFGGIVIPAGVNVAMCPYMMNRNPDYFPNPETFDPERFSPEECSKRHPFAYIPFSAGPRNCIGQKFAFIEIKATLSNILRNYEVVSSGTTQNFELYSEITLKSKTGINIKLKKRDYNK